MLAGIANFLFGDSFNNNALDENDKENRNVETVINGNAGEDEGWILIDTESEKANEKMKLEKKNGNEMDDDERTNYVPNLCNLIVSVNNVTTNNCNTLTAIHLNEMPNITNFSSSNSSSSSNNGMMEGSWFVTPPPCFTHPNTFTMESSPLEDILIEHPSISVFCPHPSSKGHSHYSHNHLQPKQHQQNHYRERSKDKKVEEPVKKVSANRCKKRTNVTDKQESQRSRSVTISDLSIKAGLLAEITNMTAPMQKANEIASQKYLKKTYMDRQNKVACRFNGRPSRQKKLSTTINGYSVNRKMC